MLGALEMHGKSHGQRVSCLHRCSAPRYSEKCVKVPDQIIVHLLENIFLFLFLFFLSPFSLRPGGCSLAWSTRAPNACIFFLFCLTELQTLKIHLSLYIFQSVVRITLSLELTPGLPQTGSFWWVIIPLGPHRGDGVPSGCGQDGWWGQ